MRNRLLSIVLSVLMVFAFMPVLPGGQAHAVSFTPVEDGVEFSCDKSDALYFEYLPEQELRGDYVAIQMLHISGGNTPNVTIVDSSGKSIGETRQTWTGSQIWLSNNKMPKTSKVYLKITSGLGAKFKIISYPYFYNQSKGEASEIADNTEIKGYEYMAYRDSYSSYGMLWYFIKATEKCKFKVTSDATLNVTNGKADPVRINAGESKKFTVNKGDKLYICMESKCQDRTLTVYRDEFNYMTSMKFDKSTYNVSEGSSKTVTLKYTKKNSSKNLESTIPAKKAKLYNASGAYVEEVPMIDGDISKYKLSYKNPGKYTMKITNSEGMTATATVNITPKKMNVKGASSEGTHKSSKVHWGTQIGADKYKVYVATSKDGTYSYKGSTKKNDYNIKELKSNKTYYVKVTACATGTYNGKSYTVEGPKSEAIKIITAPSKKPRIKRAKCTGTKYTKGSSTYHVGHYDAGGVWHKGYWTKTSSTSTAAIKIKHTKVKGATSYQSNGNGFQLNKGIAGYSFTGKIGSGKSTTVKVRAVKKSGSSVAYGPWSNGKKVKVKAAK